MEFIQGRSVTFTLSFNAEYDYTNIQDIVVKINKSTLGTLSDDTLLTTANPRVFRLELTSAQTALLKEVSYLQVFLDDVVMGVRPFTQQQIRAIRQLEFSNSSVNEGSDFTLSLTVEEGSEEIAVDTVTIYNAISQIQVDAIEDFSITASTAATTATTQAGISTAQAVIATTQASEASVSAAAAVTTLSTSLLKANNLSDLVSASTARTNLGLGTLATQSGTFSGTSSGNNTGDQDLSGYELLSNKQTDLTASATKYPTVNAVNTGLWLKSNLASPTFTGTPTLPTGTIGVTQTAGNSTTALATTAFVTTANNLKANIASPTFTGTATIPTLSVTNDATINGVRVGLGGGSVSNNIIMGIAPLASNTTGSNNVGFGDGALSSNTTGNNNIGIGRSAIRNNTTGSDNIAIGFTSARFIADGLTSNTLSSSSIFIGSNTFPLAASQTNQIVIGNSATGLGSNTTVLGNSSTTQTRIYGSLNIGGNTLEATALFNIESTTKGVLLPRLATTQVNAITTPANGLMVYNTTLNKLCVYENSVWKQVTTTTM